jgi:hypothetical protein
MKYIEISAKCSDLCYVELKDKDNKTLAVRDGYVPDFFPGEHYGDYVMLKIELKTGKIVDWTAPTKGQLKQAFNGQR